MDETCLIYKAFADCIIALIVIWFAACSISRPLGAWWKKLERNMRKYPRCRKALMVLLILFCLSYIGTSIYVALVQSKPQSPIYANQIILKGHVHNFDRNFYRFISTYNGLDSGDIRDLENTWMP
jgi:hypothetical protein